MSKKMNDPSANFTKPTESRKIGRNNIARRLFGAGATTGLLGGVWFFVAAIFSTIYNFLFSDAREGSWLFLAVLPLWIFGAICFDQCGDRAKDNFKDL